MTNASRPQFVYTIYIATTPEKLWEALTSTRFTERYFFARSIESDWKIGSPVIFRTQDGQLDVEGKVLVSDPPHLLSYTWTSAVDHTLHETPTHVTFELKPVGSTVRL